MLKTSKGYRPKEIIVSVQQWTEIIDKTKDGITKKLLATSKLFEAGEVDDICAGIHTFALEEFGKLLLLKECKHVPQKTDKVTLLSQ